jgi:DNA invertase Pin-like site-specific DNA recombinase
MANVIASISVYENEVRSERILAGQASARATGKRWGGSMRGRRLKVTDEQIATIRRMSADGESKSAMARATALSRPTIFSVLAANG